MKILKILIVVIIIAGLGFILFKNKIVQKNEPVKNQPSVQTIIQDKSPRIVSTKPDPLDETIIPASDPIEITFNIPLQNVPEFKIRFEPKPDYKVELSSDRKTARIIFIKPLDLGTTFTLYIQPDTKFDGVGEWKQDKTFHFRTIKYTGV